MASWRSVVLELTSRAGGDHSVGCNPDEATVEAPLEATSSGNAGKQLSSQIINEFLKLS